MARKPITEFRRFIDGVNDARAEQYLGKPGSGIVDEEAFNEIQAHLRDYYTGVEPEHSFLDAGGMVFDCIPIEQQYSLRGHKGPLPKRRELPPGLARPSDDMSKRVVQLHENFFDRLGNRMFCPEGMIPVQRLTLPWLTRFPDLQAFQNKYHTQQHRPLQQHTAFRYVPSPPPEPKYHQWAVGQQGLANHGGGAILNVWDPQVTWPPQGMSLSQLWFGSASGLETVEAGWQVNPFRYPHNSPALFCYRSFDKKNWYNLDGGFVQQDHTWVLGGALPAWSSDGGTQIELTVAYHLEADGWWLIVNGTRIGHYPIALFAGGTLGAGAIQAVFGGEVATSNLTSWPEMGSGKLAAVDPGHVAYQRQCQYISTQEDTYNAVLQPRPNGYPQCYTVMIENNLPAPSGTTVWFGGASPMANCQCGDPPPP